MGDQARGLAFINTDIIQYTLAIAHLKLYQVYSPLRGMMA